MERKKYQNNASLAKSIYILDRMAQGANADTIAEELGVSRATVTARLRQEYNYYLEQMGNIVATIKMDQTAKLQYIYQQAIQAWNLSAKVEDGKVGRPGDPKYLDSAMKSMAEVRKIWNADRDIEITKDGFVLPDTEERKALGTSPNPVKDVISVLQQTGALPANIDMDLIRERLIPIEGEYEEES